MIALLTAALAVSHSIVASQHVSTPVLSNLPESHSISYFQHHEPSAPSITASLPASATPVSSPSQSSLATIVTPELSAAIPAATAVPTVKPLQKRQGIWREPYTTSYDTPGCRPITLAPGTFYFGDTTVVIPRPAATETAAPIVFHPLCLKGRPALGLVANNGSEVPSVVPNAMAEWKDWISDGGSFVKSVVPLLYSIAASFAVCWLLLLIVMGFQTHRSVLYRLSLLCCSIYLLVVLINFTKIFNDQFHRGYLDALEARHIVKSKHKLHILNLAFNTLIYFAQVQVAMSLFNRQKEKRMVLWLGGSLTIVAQTIYGVSVFHPASVLTSLSTFAYLFQIALGVLYTCCVFYYAITNRQSSFMRDPSMFLLTVLALLAAMSPIILFIVDLANVWIFEWSDALSWVMSMLAIVTVREWADRVYTAEKIREKNGVLGRQIFEDETGPAAIHRTAKPRRPSTDEDDNNDDALANNGRPWDEESELTGSTYNQHTTTSSAAQRSHMPSRSFQQTPQPRHTSFNGLRPLHDHNISPGSSPRPIITHAVIDSPLDPYEDKSVLVQYMRKIVNPIIFVSDIVINFGMSVSRPLSSGSNNNNAHGAGANDADPPRNSEIAIVNTQTSLTSIDDNTNNHTTSIGSVRTNDTAASKDSMSTQQLPLQQFHYPQRRSVHHNNQQQQ